MAGYEMLLLLYSNIETWREVKIPKNINFKQLNNLIQKIFGFENRHMWQFKVAAEIPGEDAVDLNDIVKEISMEESEDIAIEEIFDKHSVLLYEYDFGDSWEIVVQKKSDIDYDNNTALITDYAGKYNPMDDIGGIMVFEEIMESIDDEDFDDEDLDFLLDDYGLKRSDISKMDFEKKYKKGSKIRIN